MTDLAIRESEIVAHDPDQIDGSRLPISIVSISFLLLGLVGWVTGIGELKGTGFLFYVLFGFGSAILVVMGGSSCNALAFSAPISVSVAIAVGFVLVKTQSWGIGTAVFVLLVKETPFGGGSQ